LQLVSTEGFTPSLCAQVVPKDAAFVDFSDSGFENT